MTMVRRQNNIIWASRNRIRVTSSQIGFERHEKEICRRGYHKYLLLPVEAKSKSWCQCRLRFLLLVFTYSLSKTERKPRNKELGPALCARCNALGQTFRSTTFSGFFTHCSTRSFRSRKNVSFCSSPISSNKLARELSLCLIMCPETDRKL